MEKEKETIGIETGDFITPKKAITITTISMVIWFITGGSYALLKLIFTGMDYLTYTFVVSFILSILFSIYVVSKLARKTDLVMKIIIGALNAILIYTSVNGAQATYGFLNPKPQDSGLPNPPPKEKTMGFLIPFLDPRPWIPDKVLMAENEYLKNENEKLSQQLLDLQSGISNTQPSSMRDSLISFERRNTQCQKNNNQLSGQLESLRGRIQQFNTRQGMWSQKTGGKVNTRPNATRYVPKDLAVSIKQQVNRVMGDSTYYNFLFLTPIDIK